MVDDFLRFSLYFQWGGAGLFSIVTNEPFAPVAHLVSTLHFAPLVRVPIICNMCLK